MDLVARLKLFFDQLSLQNSQIADMAGIPRPTLSQLLTGRNKKVSNELIEKLHVAFPNLNIVWLLFGEGDMLVDQNIKFSEPQNSLFPDESFEQSAEDEPFTALKPVVEDILDFDTRKIKPSVAAINQVTDAANSDPARRVQSIMVFYNDNSFEVFEPARKTEHD